MATALFEKIDFSEDPMKQVSPHEEAPLSLEDLEPRMATKCVCIVTFEGVCLSHYPSAQSAHCRNGYGISNRIRGGLEPHNRPPQGYSGSPLTPPATSMSEQTGVRAGKGANVSLRDVGEHKEMCNIWADWGMPHGPSDGTMSGRSTVPVTATATVALRPYPSGAEPVTATGTVTLT